MFTQAIESAIKFTRPIHTISRTYGTSSIQAGASSLFFVNNDGWALTCGHVGKQIAISSKVLARKIVFEKEQLSPPAGKTKKKWKKALEKKHNLTNSETYEMYNNFVNCVEGKLDADIKIHKEIDVALIHFKNYSNLLCDTFPKFISDDSFVKPGRSVCRLGYPFAEFTNYEYIQEEDRIKWTTEGQRTTPYFPVDGMITRRLLGKENKLIGFELSTPGLRGQSGGPAFDVNGRILGMQAATAHLDMNFDIDKAFSGRERKRMLKTMLFFMLDIVSMFRF